MIFSCVCACVEFLRACRLRCKPQGRYTNVCRYAWRLPAALSALGAESLSLACPRESNQREGHPRGRAFRAPALQVHRWATGFFDSTSCADEKLARIPASHPTGFPSPTCRALWDPLAHIRVRTRCQRVALVEQKQELKIATSHRHATNPATGAKRRWPRRMRACSSGPLGGGEGWAEKPAGKPTRRSACFSSAHGWAVEKPRPPFTHLAGRTPAKRPLGVPFSLVTFSWARKRK